jgi:hypothetical protein
MRPPRITYQCWGTPGSPEATFIPDPPDQTIQPKKGQKFLYVLEAPDEGCAMVLHYRKQRLGYYRIPQDQWPAELKVPKVGDVIYVPTALYLSHGADDFTGGKALVTDVHCTYVNGGLEPVIEIRERPNRGYYWKTTIGEQQEKLAEEYGDNWSHPSPDMHPDANRWD